MFNEHSRVQCRPALLCRTVPTAGVLLSETAGSFCSLLSVWSALTVWCRGVTSRQQHAARVYLILISSDRDLELVLVIIAICTLWAGCWQAACVWAAPNPVSNVLQIDLEPEEAQKYLDNPPFAEPQLAGRTAILPLVRYDDPRFRSAEAGPTLGHYWRNGQEIQDPENYQEEVYDAAQYHAQSGRGDYAYGYRTPESAKVEDRAGSGNLKGSYVYRDANNDLVKVRYWADSQGFHQEDNLPKVELKPVEETEEVRAARQEHERAWQQARAASLLAPLPQEYQPAASEPRGSVLAAPAQPPPHSARDAKALPYGQQHYYTTTTTTEEPEPTGPPRGFFYSFTYPVSVIVPREGAQLAHGYQEPGLLAARRS